MFKRLLSFLIILFSLALIFGASNTLALGNPVKISTSSNDAAFPQTVTDSKGYLHSVWMELNAGNGIFSGQNPGIYYSRWNGDTWSTPLKISENTDFAANPSIAVDSNDTVHVTWDDGTYGNCGTGNPPPCQAGTSLPIVVYRSRTSTGTWSSISIIDLPAGTIASRDSRIAINSANEPNLFFDATELSHDSIYWTRFTAGAWTTPQLISLNAAGNTITDTQWADVKNDNAGNIHIVYWSWNQSLQYRKLTNNVLSTAFQVNTSGSMQGTKLGATPLGEVFITWFQGSDTSVNVRWTQSGVWQAPVALTTAVRGSHWGFPIMGVTTDSKERAYVGWGELNSGNNLIDLKYKAFSAGTWSATQNVDLGNQDADTPFVYADKWDNQHFMWSEKNASTGLWELMYRVNEGTVSTLTTAGGTITANPFNITQSTLTVPSGALAATTQIGIQIGPVPESVSPTTVTIPKAYTFRPSGLTFNTPATVRVFYTDAEAVGLNENLLQPWVWDSVNATWSAQTVTSRNTAQNRMDISLNHFSLYGISAPRVIVDWDKPKDNKAIKGNDLEYSFKIYNGDKTAIIGIINPEDLKVVLKNSAGTVLQTDLNQKKEAELKHKDTKVEGEMKIKGYPNGTYSLEVYLFGSLMDTKSIEFK